MVERASDRLVTLRLQTLSQSLGLICSAVGVAVLLGWVFRIDILRSAGRGFINMQPPTAVCLLLLGGSVWLAARRIAPMVILSACAFAFLIATLTALEYLTHSNLGPDGWFFSHQIYTQTVQPRFPGRMAEGAAASVIVLSIAIGLQAAWRGKAPAKLHLLLCGLPVLVGGVSLLAYLLEINNVRGVIGYTDIALHTAASICLLSVATVALRTDMPWLNLLAGETIGGRIARRILPVLLVFPALLAWLALEAAKAGMISAEFRLALVTLGTTVGLALLGLESARRIALGERKSVGEQAQLAASEARFKAIVDHARQAILTVDEQGLITGWNTQAQIIFGWTASEVIGHDVAQTIAPAHLLDQHARAWRRILSDPQGAGEGQRAEITARRKYGECFPAELALSAVCGPDGWEVTVLMQDISQRRARTELFENAFRHAPIGMALVDLNGRLLKVNDSFLQIVGYGREEALNLDFQTITHPDDLAADLAGVNRLLSGEAESYKLDKRYISRDGRVVWTSLSVSLAYTEAGAPAHFVSQIEDLTQRHDAEQALKDSETRYRLLAENGSDIIIRRNLSGVMSYCSPAVRALGWQPEDLVNRSRNDFIHPDDLPVAAKTLNELLAGREVEGGTYLRLLTRAGDHVWFEAAPSIIRDAQGAPVEVVTSLRNVSGRRAIEEDLRVAKLAAEAATAAKSDFLANMSHEIRTPLTAIIGFTGLLGARPNLDDGARSHVKRIASAGKALLAIVNDVLDFSKLEAGQFETLAKPVSPLEEVQSTILMFSPDAEAKGLSLDFHTEGPVPERVSLDPDRLRQILVNLISNAMKFTVEGHVRISMRFDELSSSLCLSVEDTGPGIDEVQQGKLFQRFSQVDASSTRRHGGTGLGLAICKGLAEAMGGAIAVQSTPGVGSVFSFSVSAPVLPVDQTSEACAMVHPDIVGARILIIDDNPTDRERARALLESAGAEVSEACDFNEALAHTSTTPYDLILLDILHPSEDGRGTLNRLRAADGPNSFIPVLAFTAHAQGDICVGGPDGFDGLAPKPVEKATLIEAVHRWTAVDAPALQEDRRAS